MGEKAMIILIAAWFIMSFVSILDWLKERKRNRNNEEENDEVDDNLE